MLNSAMPCLKSSLLFILQSLHVVYLIFFPKRLLTWNKMMFSGALQICRSSNIWNKFTHLSGRNSVCCVLVKNKTNHILHRRGFADEDDALEMKTYWRSSKSWIALGMCFWCRSVEKTERDSSQVRFSNSDDQSWINCDRSNERGSDWGNSKRSRH